MFGYHYIIAPLLIGLALGESCSNIIDYQSVWDEGTSGIIHAKFPETTSSWHMTVTFDLPITDFEVYVGGNVQCNDGVSCSFDNLDWDGEITSGDILDVAFVYHFNSNSEISALSVNGVDICGYPPITTTKKPTPTTSAKPTETTTTSEGHSTSPTKSTTPHSTVPTTSWNGPCVPDNYGFADVIDNSLLFYEVQRSGDLPESEMRVKWRKDSALDDRGKNGEDLTGGYYDAGDFVKFGFPMASSVTMLAWGGISYQQGYNEAGMLEYLRDAVKWGTDYFIKAHVSPNEFYGQVGDGFKDHASWGRPEDMTMDRPAWKIDSNNPGTDLACETAAALASASILFKDVDSAYSEELLTHARQLFEFGDQYRGVYSDSITGAADFYRSWNGYNDELVWAALWLHKATGESDYLTKAQDWFTEFEFEGINEVFSWDDKVAGAKILLAEATGSSNDISSVKTLCQTYVDYPRSPQGRTHFMQWGSNRYASNGAFICLKASDITGEDSFREYALGQVEYMLGTTGRSFVCGFGTNPPQRPHHRSSSCPDSGTCDWNDFNNPGANPHVLYGALVGGPQYESSDTISDRRDDFVESEVATDYNAGFQSTVAGLLSKAC